MKRALLLLFAIFLCSNAYSKEQTKTYTIKGKGGYPCATITCRGNFQNGILSDGPISLSLSLQHEDIILEGIYRSDSTYTFLGTYKEEYGPVLGCYGTIYNDKESRSISKKSSAKEWEIDLQFYMFINNDPQIKAITESQFQLSIKKEATESFWNYTIRNNEIRKRDSIAATVYFPNGCRYIGPIYNIYRRFFNDIWHIGDNFNDFNYQYIWPNGDYFIGKFKGAGDTTKEVNPLIIEAKSRRSRVDSGCFHLVDGSTLDYYKDYLTQYKKLLTEQDGYLNPSQLLPVLKERKRKEEAEKQRKEQEEKLQREKERKLEQEARLKKEREQQAKAEQRRKLLIQKYGQKWGELLAQGKIELGMTKQMCQEVVNIEFYNISRSNYYGRIVETWMYDQEKLRMSSGGAFLGMALLEGFANTFGLQTPTVVQYTYLVFTDGKLTSIY